MQAQRPPQMPLLHSQLQQNSGSPPPPKGPPPPAQTPAEESADGSFITSTLPTIIMLSAFAGLCVLGWYAYEEATNPRDLTDLPVIKAENTPYKIKPAHPGGMKIANLDKTVYNTISENNVQDEQQAKVNPVTTVEEPLDRETIKKIDEKSKIAKLEPAAIKKTVESPKKTETISSLKIPLPVPEYYLNDKLGTTNDTFDSVPVPVKRPAENAEIQQVETTKLIPPPASMPYAQPKKSAVSRDETRMFLNNIKIQLGAFRSTEEVQSSWVRIKAKYPRLLGNFSYGIQKADLGIRGIFYRLHAGPLKSRDAAGILCKKLIAKGQGCFIAK